MEINWDEKKTYVTSLVIVTAVKQKTIESSLERGFLCT